MAAQKLKIARKVSMLRRQVAAWKEVGERIALVPTMGALHEGHLTLVRAAKRKAGKVVVSIFVNPTQFAPTEDLSRYPRDEAGDVKKLAQAGADLVWAPTATEMYPEQFATRIVPAGAAEGLEGEFRPHHFSGVATVCCKLFSQVVPDIAVFGEKDYQQLAVIRQTVRDLDLPLQIAGIATVRARDGLALSSRNAYLSEEERAIAPSLNAALRELSKAVRAGDSVIAAVAAARAAVKKAGFHRVDYIEVRDAETLAPYDPKSTRKGRILAAAWLGRTRLIDNIAL